MRKNIQLITASICTFLFFFIMYLVITKKIDNLDQRFYQKVSRLINPENTKIMKIITNLGSATGIIISIVISYFFLKNNFNRTFITLGMMGEVAVNNLLKVLVKRLRPTINPLVQETNYSFPSGHTMAITALYLFFIFFLWKSPLTKSIKIILTIVSLVIIIAVSFSRIYLGVHYLSDVLGGLFCSTAIVLILLHFYKPLKMLWFH